MSRPVVKIVRDLNNWNSNKLVAPTDMTMHYVGSHRLSKHVDIAGMPWSGHAMQESQRVPSSQMTGNGAGNGLSVYRGDYCQLSEGK